MRVLRFFWRLIVGLCAAVGLVVIVGLVGLGLLWRELEPLATGREVAVPEAAVLTLDLANGLSEARAESPFAWASFDGPLVLREVVETLDAAGADPRVRGLFLRLGPGEFNMAQVQELRDAIAAFRARGKFAVAFAESFGEAGDGTLHYYLASSAGRIWLQPSGELGITGFRLESPFLRDALDAWGIVPRVDQRKAYKGVASIATEDSLPEPQRRNLQRLVDSWLEQTVAGITEGRSLSEETVRGLIDRAPHGAAAAREAGLVDETGYLDQAEDAALAAADGADGADAEFLSLAAYRDRSEAEETGGETIALVHGLGPVTLGDSEEDPLFGSLTMGVDTVAEAIRDAAESPDVRAILFRIDSPGGSYVASDAIWRAVEQARAGGMPVVVSMGGVAASGGYFVAAPASRIVAQPGTLTGSIGVAGGKLVLTGLWDRLDIGWDGVQAGENAAIDSFNHDYSDAGWAKLQDSLDRVYADFTAKVAAGRSLGPEAVEEAAQGKVFTGADAKDLGLVDALGGYRTALGLARELAGLPPDAELRIEVFPEPRDPFNAILEDLLNGELPIRVRSELARLARLAEVLQPLARALEAVEPAGGGPRLQAPRSLPTR